MAEGLANFYGKEKVLAFSAGTHPVPVNSYAIKVMQEMGIDISEAALGHCRPGWDQGAARERFSRPSESVATG